MSKIFNIVNPGQEIRFTTSSGSKYTLVYQGAVLEQPEKPNTSKLLAKCLLVSRNTESLDRTICINGPRLTIGQSIGFLYELGSKPIVTTPILAIQVEDLACKFDGITFKGLEDSPLNATGTKELISSTGNLGTSESLLPSIKNAASRIGGALLSLVK